MCAIKLSIFINETIPIVQRSRVTSTIVEEANR